MSEPEVWSPGSSLTGEVLCPICGSIEDADAMDVHITHEHPDHPDRVYSDTSPSHVVVCPVCGSLEPALSMSDHLRTSHPDHIGDAPIIIDPDGLAL